MFMRTRLVDAATLLDDFVEDCGLPAEHWLVMARSVAEIDAGEELMDQMKARLEEILAPLPTFELRITMNGPFGPVYAKTHIKGANVKMAVCLAVFGLENNGVDFQQVEPWPTNGS